MPVPEHVPGDCYVWGSSEPANGGKAGVVSSSVPGWQHSNVPTLVENTNHLDVHQVHVASLFGESIQCHICMLTAVGMVVLQCHPVPAAEHSPYDAWRVKGWCRQCSGVLAFTGILGLCCKRSCSCCNAGHGVHVDPVVHHRGSSGYDYARLAQLAVGM